MKCRIVGVGGVAVRSIIVKCRIVGGIGIRSEIEKSVELLSESVLVVTLWSVELLEVNRSVGLVLVRAVDPLSSFTPF